MYLQQHIYIIIIIIITIKARPAGQNHQLDTPSLSIPRQINNNDNNNTNNTNNRGRTAPFAARRPGPRAGPGTHPMVQMKRPMPAEMAWRRSLGTAWDGGEGGRRGGGWEVGGG